MTCAYGWGEHSKGLHAATTRGIHIFWALCYPSGQQKATFRPQATLRETKPIRRGVGIIKREKRWKEQSNVGSPELSWGADHPTDLEQTNSAYKAQAWELQEGSRRAPGSCSQAATINWATLSTCKLHCRGNVPNPLGRGEGNVENISKFTQWLCFYTANQQQKEVNTGGNFNSVKAQSCNPGSSLRAVLHTDGCAENTGT